MNKKTLILALALLVSTPVFAASDFQYPFDKIAKPSCKRLAWGDLGDDCKMDVPHILNADYPKYKDDTLYRRVYSVLWEWTYDYGWDVGYGSHQGVDIATSEGTPVLAIADGTVVAAGSISGWGNVITIKHTLADKTNIFSDYAHLSGINVSKGDIVRKGQVIGAVGSTGHSYGNHLHFQIDITNQSHPYYYSTCAKGMDELKVVNAGMCRDYLSANTIDPIAFLETGNLAVVTPTVQTIEKIKDKEAPKISPKTIKSRQEIIDEEAAEYLKSYSIDIAIAPEGANLQVWGALNTTISVHDWRGQVPKGNLPEAGLKISYDDKALAVFPNTIIALDGGARPFSVSAKKSGTYDITFSLGKTVLGKRSIYVVKKGEKLEPTSVEIRVAPKLDVSAESNLYIVPRTKFGSYLTDMPYDTRYRITVLKGKAKFCNLSNTAATTCNPLLVAEQLDFGYNESYRGYFKGKIIPLDFAPVVFTVTKIGDKNPSAKSRSLTIRPPIGLDKRNIYYDSILAGLKRNWWKTYSGYAQESKDVTTKEANEIMKRILAYRALKAGGDKIKKAWAINLLTLYLGQSKNFPDKTWSRGAFADLLLKTLGVGLIQSQNASLVDESGAWKDTITTLRLKYGFAWQDQFGNRYFQPDKPITIAEALYMTDIVVGKTDLLQTADAKVRN